MRAIFYVTCILVVMSAPEGIAQDRKITFIYSGFMTGEECHRHSDASIGWYMAGVVDGLLVSPFAGAPETRIKPLNQCLTGVTSTQLSATLKKWLKEHPERWHEGCHVAAFSALKQMCEDF